jgi:hypothetical protein
MELFLKNRKTGFFLLVLAVLFFQCQEPVKEKAESVKSGASCSVKKPLNPNGDSELALLMRDMYNTSDSLRIEVERGRITSKFPQRFHEMHSALATDPSVKNKTFSILAADYLKGLKVLYSSSQEKLKSNYNESVQKCISCHENFCPGPIQKITKLKFAI